MTPLALDLLLPPQGPGPAPIVTVTSRTDSDAVAEAASGGVVAVVPRRWRRPLHRLGDLPGVETVRYLLLPDAEAPSFVVPLAPPALRYAAAHIGPVWASRLGAALSHVPPGLLFQAAPWAAVAAFGQGAEPFAWLSEHAPTAVRHVVLRPSWRGDGAAVVVGFNAGGPVIVAKVRPGGQGVCREAEALSALSPAAEAAGAAVPHALARADRAGAPVLLATPVGGVPAAGLAAWGRAPVPEILGHLRRWLERWHRATRTAVRVGPEHLGAWVEAPLARLGADVPDGVATHVRALAEAVSGQEVPLVAAHHDLTMRNVLLGGAAPLGVVDWEEAEPLALPLTDWLYAAVDLVYAAQGGSRVDAARAALAPGGLHAEAVEAGVRALVSAAGLGPEAVALARHVVWLRHAANEAASAAPGARRPFLDVLLALAH